MGDLNSNLDLTGKPLVLVVDDEESNCLVFVKALQLMGYEAESAGNGRIALEKLEHKKFDVMLLDLKMPEMDGEVVLKRIRDKFPGMGVIVLTAHATLESAIGAVRSGAVDYLIKPQKIADIEAAIQRALKSRESVRQKEHLIRVMEHTLSMIKEGSAGLQKNPIPAQDLIQCGQCIINTQTRSLTVLTEVNDQTTKVLREVDLTEVQIKIMLFLFRNEHKVVGSNEVAKYALGYFDLSEIEAERIIRPHIMKLRRKIETDPENPQFIRSIRGKGYCFSGIGK